MRVNIVGTHCEWVTRYFSITRSASAGIEFLHDNEVPPLACTAQLNFSGAA